MSEVWPRLGTMWLRALLPGLALAIALFVLQFGLIFMVSELTLGFDTRLAAAPAIGLFAIVIISHALFISLLADGLVRQRLRPRRRAFWAAMVLAIPIALFAFVDSVGAAYGCADGKAIDRTVIPMWPWAWIGWLVLAQSALPSRLLGYHPARLEPWFDRAMMLAPFAAVILFVGTPFQQREIDCRAPTNDGWGLFEGGLIAFPLLGLFLFSMAFALGVLSAAYVRPTNESPSE